MDGENERAAARCTRCGEIGIVLVGPDGTFEPIGQPELCSCDGRTLRILERTLDDPDDGS
ncbi:hypothetical protein [Natrarchaeobius oligotrophus]|uniref:hypothetical protein n=1 Tax=Natrarchaeobius oligotrophus TaxID=3455743 RepID=UPI001FB37B52|nr:hypothetical protein [Natrarchaeobius chitinivorans]